MTHAETLVSFVWAIPSFSEESVMRYRHIGATKRAVHELDETSDWSVVEEFLSSGATARRRLISGPVLDLADASLPVEVHTTWHERYGTATVIASVDLTSVVTPKEPEAADVVVAVIQSMLGRPSNGGEMTARAGTETGGSLREAVFSALQEIDPQLEGVDSHAHAWCIELRDPRPLDDAEFSDWRQAYGMAAGDEGWRFISPDLAASRMESVWATRDFVDVRTAGHGVLLRNAKGPDYVKSQAEFMRRFFGAEEPYFALSPAVAGLDHGVLHALERVTVRRALASEWLNEVRRLHEGRHPEARELVRMKLDHINELLNSQLIAEVDSMEKILGDRHGLTVLVDQLDRLGDAMDEQTRFAHEASVNRRITRLTWITIVLTVVTVVQPVAPQILKWFEG